jgi:hypothetical protein
MCTTLLPASLPNIDPGRKWKITISKRNVPRRGSGGRKYMTERAGRELVGVEGRGRKS